MPHNKNNPEVPLPPEVMQPKLNKEYGGKQSVTTILYDGVGTSAGDASVLRSIPPHANAEQRITALQEANEVAVQKFLQRLLDRLKNEKTGGVSDQAPSPKFTLFEGGSGKGAALQQYQEVFGDNLGAVVAVELSDEQYAKQQQFVEGWIKEGTKGFTAENTLFIDNPQLFFQANPRASYAELVGQYKFILVKGDVQEELQRSQGSHLEYDAAVFIESIIHMNRAEITQAVMDVLADGGLFALTDVGVISALSSISDIVAKLLDNRANVRPNGAEWWQENYSDSLVALFSKDEDQRATAKELARMLLDRKMFQRVIKTFTEEGGMSHARALRQYILDLLLFSSGSPIVTTYDVTLQKKSE
jgi:hypothetical protein